MDVCGSVESDGAIQKNQMVAVSHQARRPSARAGQRASGFRLRPLCARVAHAAPAHVTATGIALLTPQNRPEREFLGLHAMTFKRDPVTGSWIQPETLPAEAPGSLPHTTAPVWVKYWLRNSTLDDKTIDEIYRAILRITWRELAAGERVLWPKIGTLSAYRVAGRWGRNPRTGDSMWIPTFWRIKMDLAKKAKATIR